MTKRSRHCVPPRSAPLVLRPSNDSQPSPMQLEGGASNSSSRTNSQLHHYVQRAPPLDGNTQPSPTQLERGSSSNNSRTNRNQTRGPTRLLKIFNRRVGDPKVHVEWDKDNQPVGSNAKKISCLCGVILRTPGRISWSEKQWSCVEDNVKDWIWDSIKDVVEIEEFRKDYVIGPYMADKFRHTKARWKINHYKPYNTEEERKENKPKSCMMDEWEALLRFWDTPIAQAVSEQNRVNRSKQKMKHTGGSKSFACIRHELTLRNGTAPTQGDMFCVTHMDSNNRPADPISEEYIDEMLRLAGIDKEGGVTSISDDIYDQVMPPDRHGRLMGFGPGVTSKSHFSSASNQPRGNTASQLESMRLQMESQQRELDAYKQREMERDMEMENMRRMIQEMIAAPCRPPTCS